MMDFHEHLSHWESFYLLVGTAGATLTGLLLLLAGWDCWRGDVEGGLTLAGVASLSLLLTALRNTLDMLMSAMSYNARMERQEQNRDG